jgi:hypothetical protein
MSRATSAPREPAPEKIFPKKSALNPKTRPKLSPFGRIYRGTALWPPSNSGNLSKPVIFGSFRKFSEMPRQVLPVQRCARIPNNSDQKSEILRIAAEFREVHSVAPSKAIARPPPVTVTKPPAATRHQGFCHHPFSQGVRKRNHPRWSPASCQDKIPFLHSRLGPKRGGSCSTLI